MQTRNDLVTKRGERNWTMTSQTQGKGNEPKMQAYTNPERRKDVFPKQSVAPQMGQMGKLSGPQYRCTILK